MQKFTFGDDFDIERRGGGARRAQDKALLEEAEQRGFASGFEAGQAAQKGSDDARLAEALHRISVSIAQFEQDKTAFLKACEIEAVSLAQALADLHGEILNGFDPHVAFTNAAREVLSQFSDAALLVARVPASLRDAAEARLNALAQEVRFHGRVSVEASHSMGDAADFSLEWPDGALRHDRQALRARIVDEFQRFGFSVTDVNGHG